MSRDSLLLTDEWLSQIANMRLITHREMRIPEWSLKPQVDIRGATLITESLLEPGDPKRHDPIVLSAILTSLKVIVRKMIGHFVCTYEGESDGCIFFYEVGVLQTRQELMDAINAVGSTEARPTASAYN